MFVHGDIFVKNIRKLSQIMNCERKFRKGIKCDDYLKKILFLNN